MYCEITLRWMPENFYEGEVSNGSSGHLATSHYMSQYWHRSMSPNGVTRPQWVNTLQSIWRSGPWFNIKMSSYQYRKFNFGDLHNGISYVGKTTSLYWIRPQASVNEIYRYPILGCHEIAHDVTGHFEWCLSSEILFKIFNITLKISIKHFVVNIVDADVLAPPGARTSAGTVLTKFRSHIYFWLRLQELKPILLLRVTYAGIWHVYF